MANKLFTYAGWTVIWLLSFYFVYNNALRYFNLNHELYTVDFRPYAPYIMVHVAGGVIALVLGPLQFITYVRTNYKSLHRALGKIYLMSVLFSGLSAFYLAIFDNLLNKHEFMFATGAMSMGVAWFVTSGMAYWTVRKRNFVQHKEWMIRSYVLTSNFIIFRLIYYYLQDLPDFQYKEHIGEFTVWISWSLPLLFTEWVLQAKKMVPKKSRKITADSSSTASETPRKPQERFQ